MVTRPVVPSLVRARVAHRRTSPVEYGFETSTPMWLVDVDDPGAAFAPVPQALASIRAEDHFAADDDSTLRDKVRRYLDTEGLAWSAHRVLMLVNARSFGYVFDPLTTYFCLSEAGDLEGVLAEVHNTYGERHCYPLDVAGSAGQPASVDKDFYVSPFFAVEGRYDISVRLCDGSVAVGISLTQGDRRVFTASVVGDLQPATPRLVRRAVARNPFPSQRVSALIRWHGVRLWLRRLPVVPRKPHTTPRGMASHR